MRELWFVRLDRSSVASKRGDFNRCSSLPRVKGLGSGAPVDVPEVLRSKNRAVSEWSLIDIRHSLAPRAPFVASAVEAGHLLLPHLADRASELGRPVFLIRVRLLARSWGVVHQDG